MTTTNKPLEFFIYDRNEETLLDQSFRTLEEAKKYADKECWYYDNSLDVVIYQATPVLSATVKRNPVSIE